MSERRWQPPPLDKKDDATGGRAVKVDEKVVRKMLQVNPSLRLGRTTAQVKRAIERGGSISGAGKPVQLAETATGAEGQRGDSQATELAQAVAFFVRRKAVELNHALADFAARRRELAAAEQARKEQAARDVASFLSLLDQRLVDTYGVSALAKHEEFLSCLGLSASALLASARKDRP